MCPRRIVSPMIFDPKILDDLSRKISQSLPPGVSNLQQETEQHINSLLQSGFSKLNLVPREEFDIQQAVLQRTREKLEALEKRVAEMEQQLK
jgi:BMFP domain-containing protein YqiC